MPKDIQVREQKFSIITSWQQSGLSQKAYCEQNGLRYYVFHYWYKCFRNLQLPAKGEGFIPLSIKPSTATNGYPAHVELLLPDGKRLLFHQPVSSDYLKSDY
jgi:hypothetical protein